MANKTTGALRVALLAAAGAFVLCAPASAGTHGSFGGHSSMSSHSEMSMHDSGMGMHESAGPHQVSFPPPNTSPPSPGMQAAPLNHTTDTHDHDGDHDHDHDHDHHHHHHHFDDDDFFFDPFWWGWDSYPYTVETRYVEVPVSDGYWYYCPDSKSYYPYVKECASKWERVPPTPPSAQ